MKNAHTTQLKAFLKGLHYEIEQSREAESSHVVDHHCAVACGMVYAALIFQAITGPEYDRLSTLAIEAADYRRNERTDKQAPYTWKPAKATEQEAAA